MQNKKRAFLKKMAALTATTGISATVLNAEVEVPGVKVDELIKKSSGKKDEVLYKKSPQWELYYKQAK